MCYRGVHAGSVPGRTTYLGGRRRPGRLYQGYTRREEALCAEVSSFLKREKEALCAEVSPFLRRERRDSAQRYHPSSGRGGETLRRSITLPQEEEKRLCAEV